MRLAEFSRRVLNFFAVGKNSLIVSKQEFSRLCGIIFELHKNFRTSVKKFTASVKKSGGIVRKKFEKKAFKFSRGVYHLEAGFERLGESSPPHIHTPSDDEIRGQAAHL